MIFLVWVVTETLYFAYLLHLKCTFKGWPMHNSLMEICNDGSKCMSLLWHISVFVFAFQYFTQPFPKDVALSFITSAHFQKKISLTVTNLSTRQPDGCKAKHYSPSAFTIITRSYLSKCLGQHCLFWEAERGLVDDGTLWCFSELNKNIQLCFTSLLSAEVRHGVPSIPINAAALRWKRSDCMEKRAQG